MTNSPNTPSISIYQATLAETDQKTAEVSTQDMRRILADRSAIVIDTRKAKEFAGGHIPGARNIPSSPDATPEEAVVPVLQLVGGDKGQALVLYCNGPFCKGTRRLAGQLFDAGFTNVRRYQLGMPIWRALGGPTAIDIEGVVRHFGVDRTAIYFDARGAADFAVRNLPGTHSVPADQLDNDVLHDAPLPQEDFNTRIIIFGRDSTQARILAEALSTTPFHNVTYLDGSFDALATALADAKGS